MFGMGIQELLIVGIVAVMLFGRRLPEVARSLGHSYQQFRQGLQELKGEVDDVVYTARTALPRDPVYFPTPAADSPEAEGEGPEVDSGAASVGPNEDVNHPPDPEGFVPVPGAVEVSRLSEASSGENAPTSAATGQ